MSIDHTNVTLNRFLMKGQSPATDIGLREDRIKLESLIVAKSRELDPTDAGISESAILTNEAARAYYEQHRSWKRQRRSLTSRPQPGKPPPAGTVKLTRDEVRVRQRYCRLTKAALVERLLTAERQAAEWEQRWLCRQDEVLDLRLRLESAEMRGHSSLKE